MIQEQNPRTSINHEQPRFSLIAAANQRGRQWVGSGDFYALLPSAYQSFYQNWVRFWLSWYDGYVPSIHGSQSPLVSTGIATTIVNRTADIVFGGDVMFANARKPKDVVLIGEKTVGKALDFISNNWFKKVRGQAVLKNAGRMALAGGWSLLKLNKANGELWVDSIRADRFYFEKVGSELRRVVCLLSTFDNTTAKNDGRYVVVEDRHFEELSMFGDDCPVVEYKIYKTFVSVQYAQGFMDQESLTWDQLPKCVKKAFKAKFGDARINEPQAINGFKTLGCYLLYASDGVSNVPSVDLGESILANVTAYLYEYEYYNTAFLTDMYLARGRVILPKFMQSPHARSDSPQGFDDFLFTNVPHLDNMNPEASKPQPVQFEMRSEAWRSARNTLLENIATGIGLSVSTLASYLNDAGNRTAREVSAEESATTLFVENMRRRFEMPINDMLSDVLRFYGYVDDVEIRWTRAGMTNQSVMVDVLTQAVNAGLISQKKAHHSFNYDDDEEQNEEDFLLVQKEKQAEREMPFNEVDYYGDQTDDENDGQTCEQPT